MIPIRIIQVFDQENSEIVIGSSLIRLVEGELDCLEIIRLVEEILFEGPKL